MVKRREGKEVVVVRKEKEKEVSKEGTTDKDKKYFLQSATKDERLRQRKMYRGEEREQEKNGGEEHVPSKGGHFFVSKGDLSYLLFFTEMAISHCSFFHWGCHVCSLVFLC